MFSQMNISPKHHGDCDTIPSSLLLHCRSAYALLTPPSRSTTQTRAVSVVVECLARMPKLQQLRLGVALTRTFLNGSMSDVWDALQGIARLPTQPRLEKVTVETRSLDTLHTVCSALASLKINALSVIYITDPAIPDRKLSNLPALNLSVQTLFWDGEFSEEPMHEYLGLLVHLGAVETIGLRGVPSWNGNSSMSMKLTGVNHVNWEGRIDGSAEHPWPPTFSSLRTISGNPSPGLTSLIAMNAKTLRVLKLSEVSTPMLQHLLRAVPACHALRSLVLAVKTNVEEGFNGAPPFEYLTAVEQYCSGRGISLDLSGSSIRLHSSSLHECLVSLRPLKDCLPTLSLSLHGNAGESIAQHAPAPQQNDRIYFPCLTRLEVDIDDTEINSGATSHVRSIIDFLRADLIPHLVHLRLWITSPNISYVEGVAQLLASRRLLHLERVHGRSWSRYDAREVSIQRWDDAASVALQQLLDATLKEQGFANAWEWL